ncbi:hypothetical protein G7Z17_g10608 [Cylindrodendrum hubeiense]|uniref:Uncharacterized protein n=1 Tax=Cylindrodendrum hubeiense TaxID=595255 RepID=A0A9P5H4K2_9HYPO|nr:hypothetical protein G7Z17_g10608 [Cylindrodendrum hubeiense]
MATPPASLRAADAQHVQMISMSELSTAICIPGVSCTHQAFALPTANLPAAGPRLFPTEALWRPPRVSSAAGRDPRMQHELVIERLIEEPAAVIGGDGTAIRPEDGQGACFNSPPTTSVSLAASLVILNPRWTSLSAGRATPRPHPHSTSVPTIDEQELHRTLSRCRTGTPQTSRSPPPPRRGRDVAEGEAALSGPASACGREVPSAHVDGESPERAAVAPCARDGLELTYDADATDRPAVSQACMQWY